MGFGCFSFPTIVGTHTIKPFLDNSWAKCYLKIDKIRLKICLLVEKTEKPFEKLVRVKNKTIFTFWQTGQLFCIWGNSSFSFSSWWCSFRWSSSSCWCLNINFCCIGRSICFHNWQIKLKSFIVFRVLILPSF
jgi:hypothetical protein